MALPVPRRALRSLLIFLVLPTLGLTLLIVIVTSSSSDAGGHGADAGEKLAAAAAAAGKGAAAAARGAGLRSRLGKSAGAVVGRLSDGVRRSRSGGGGSSNGAGRRAGGVDVEGPADAGAGIRRKGKKDKGEGKGKSPATRPRWAADPAAAAARRPALDHDRLDDQDDINQRYFGKPPPPPLTDDDRRDPASGPHAGHHVRPANELDPATNTLTSASLLASSSLGLATHSRLPSGLLVVDPKGRHPIYDLIAASHASWDAKRARASKTLKQASKEYRRRYGRRPPKGFDRWWAYVKKHHVQLPDEYDQIHHDLEPFFGMSSSHLRSLRSTWEAIQGTYVIQCDVTGCHLARANFAGDEEAQRVALERAEGQLSLLAEVEEALGEVLEEAGGQERAVRVTYYAHDVPFAMAGHEFRSSLEDAASVGEVIDPEEHQHDLAHIGWASACPPHKPLRTRHDPGRLPDPESFLENRSPKSFVWDHKAAMDPCEHPELTQIIGALSSYGNGKGPVPQDYMYPILAMCTTKLHADVLTVAMEAFVESIEDDPPWAEKADDRLLWRGSTTGILIQDDHPWNISQRMRLVDQADRKAGQWEVLRAQSPAHAVGHPIERRFQELNEQYLDVGFVDRPIQCGPDSSCDRVAARYDFKPRQPWSQAAQYKYVFDIDGNGWSARFKRLISTNSCVVKTTIFPEWYQDRIQPWVHYVPVKADLSDLYDVMAFFRGRGKNGKGGHDALAEEIAMAGKEWSHTFWRKEDMVAYLFRLYLEYARILAPNRDKMDYEG